MSRELYFIPIIARACEDRDRLPALSEAFSSIARLGRDPAFARVHSHFRSFMAEVARTWAAEQQEAVETESARALIVALATNTLEGGKADRQAGLNVIDSRLAWRQERQRFHAAAGLPDEVVSSQRFLLKRGGHVLGRLICEAPGCHGFADAILPGDYELCLESGRVLWERNLRDRELIWSMAFPGRALDLAADTGEAQPEPTVAESLVDGELVVRIFPGLESGRLEVELR